MKIGIFSGSFDPIHIGHAMIANYIAQQGIVDEVWLMVSRLNPLKDNSLPAADSDRLSMAALVAEGCRNVKVSDFEMTLPLPSYTYRTLCALREIYPEHRFTQIIGSDNWLEIERWMNWREIVSEFGFIIYPRPGYPIDVNNLPTNIEVVEKCPQTQLSSSFIRESIKENLNMNWFLPPAVFDYIESRGLYKVEKSCL